MSKNLVIVESPSKAKTIEKYLGKDFTVRSSMGHIRDLVKKGLGVDIDNNFAPHYEVDGDKAKLVRELADEAANAEAVWLASDEDREGEAIAWHLAEVLKLPVEKTRRIVFHEITKNAILKAIEEPRLVDMNVVNAQQARRVLDRLVGFELSPLLWKKVRPQLSAGRVQSVTVRLIVEREREIMNHASTEYWHVAAEFFRADDPAKVIFRAVCSKHFDKKNQAQEFLETCKSAAFTVASVEEKPAKRYPAPPFTTSTLQQEAGRKLGMSVSRTMSTAQKLYEKGLITYMRTDSVNLSNQALGGIKAEVIALFGEKYSNTRNYKTSSKGAQEAHEAIRPSYFDRRTIDGTAEEKKLYELIWKRAVASQMTPADVERTTVKIDVEGAREWFAANGEVVKFDGFLKLYSESTDDETPSEEGLLPKMTQGERLTAVSVVATQKYTSPAARYSEATLVKKLEELGIGRPSTYAPTITTVISRGYVEKRSKEGVPRTYTVMTLKGGAVSEKTATEKVGKEVNRLSPTDIGMLVNDYLEGQFPDILDYNFTAKVEREFDEIAEGKTQWGEMIGRFYSPFHRSIDGAMATERTDTHQVRVLGVDPATGREVSARIGRFGPMVQIEPVKEGEKPRSASLAKGQLAASITLEEALVLLSLPRSVGEMDGKEVVIGVGQFGPYAKHDGKYTSIGKENPYTITLEKAIELIRAKAEANKPIREWAELPGLVVKNGRWGPYIVCDGQNYKLPKGVDVDKMTLEDARRIVSESSPSPARKKFTRKK